MEVTLPKEEHIYESKIEEKLEFKSVGIEATEELKQLHEIAKKISYVSTRNSELNKLVELAIKNNFPEYAILITNDISYTSDKNTALTKICESLVAQNKTQEAIKTAELITYVSTRNAMIQKILLATKKNVYNK